MKNSTIRFGTWETVSMFLNLLNMQMALSFPRLMAQDAGNAGWLHTLYLSLLMILAFAIISRLYKNFDGMDIVDISDYIGGSLVRVVVGLMYIGYFAFALVITLREISENMKTVALPQSPLSFIIIFFCIAMAISGILGIEGVVRISMIMVPFLAAAHVIILAFVSPYYDINNILPILGNGPKEIFFKGLNRISIFAGISGIYIVQPFLGGHRNFKKSGYLTLIFSGLVLTAGSLCYQLAYPYPGSTQSFLPMYFLSRQIYFGRFFQRVESFFLFMWASAGMLYLSTLFSFILNLLKKTFNFEYIKPLIFPTLIIFFTVSLFPSSLMSVLKLESSILRTYGWTFAIFLPILLLVIAKSKKKSQKKEAVGK